MKLEKLMTLLRYHLFKTTCWRITGIINLISNNWKANRQMVFIYGFLSYGLVFISIFFLMIFPFILLDKKKFMNLFQCFCFIMLASDNKPLREGEKLACYLKSFFISFLLDIYSHTCRKNWQEQHFKVFSSVIILYSVLTTVTCRLCFPVLLWTILESFLLLCIFSNLIYIFKETFLTCEIWRCKEAVLHPAWPEKELLSVTFCFTDFVEILSNISDQISWQYLGN